MRKPVANYAKIIRLWIEYHDLEKLCFSRSLGKYIKPEALIELRQELRALLTYMPELLHLFDTTRASPYPTDCGLYSHEEVDEGCQVLGLGRDLLPEIEEPSKPHQRIRIGSVE
jgi:hypothetical protein